MQIIRSWTINVKYGKILNRSRPKFADIPNKVRKPKGDGHYCGRYAFANVREGTYTRNRCGSRSCKYKQCREKYAWKRIKEITELVEDNDLNRFLTLTLNPANFPTVKDAWGQIPKIWDKMAKRMRRAFPGIKYVMILEKHKRNDRPHIHGFVNRYIPVQWLWKNWSEVGGGEGGYIENVSSSVTAYVTKQLHVAKYVGKDNLNVGNWVRPRQRVIWKSRGLVKRDHPNTHTFKFVSGYRLFDEQGKKTLTDFEIDRIIDRVALCIPERSLSDEILERGMKNEAQQSWEYVETTFSQIFTPSSENRQQNVASNGGELERPKTGESSPCPKVEDQCDNQEVKRQINQLTFDWS